MKLPLRLVCCVVALWVAELKAEDFSQGLTPEEFKAAGLDKLSPAELAKLNALVNGQHTVEIAKIREETAAKVREETTVKVRAETTAQVKAEIAAKPAQPESFLHRMKVVLTPGTDISYETIETQLVGKYRGFEPGTVLTLANGQKWRVVEGSYWSPARDENKPRKVKVSPGTLGSFFIEIEEGGRAKVKIISNGS
jgi:hypothetical protein